MPSFQPVLIDRNQIGEVEVSRDPDPRRRRRDNVQNAVYAIDEILPKYRPKKHIHELSLSQDVPIQLCFMRVIKAVAEAIDGGVDGTLEDEITQAFIVQHGVHFLDDNTLP
jgi:hypothetical protein